MRIFCAVRHSVDPKYFYGALWSGNFYPALRELGHEIVESQVDLRSASEFMSVARAFSAEQLATRARITEAIVEEVKAAHRERPIDLFLSYFYNAHFDPAGFADIHRLGIPTVNFFCNSIYQFELVESVAPAANFAWHAERDARASYLRVKANPVWVQMGADPQLYFPMPTVARQPRACFVGQRYADRELWLAALVKADVPLDLYGSGWDAPASVDSTNTNNPPPPPADAPVTRSSRAILMEQIGMNLASDGPLKFIPRTIRQVQWRRRSQQFRPLLATVARGRADNLTRTFAEHDVVLNFSNVWADGRPGSRLIPHVRLRDFEGPMCGACYLTGNTDEITDFYRVGHEIDTYQHADELVEKTRFYLNHPDRAQAMRQAGHERARRDHTWRRRFEQLFAAISPGK